MAGIFDLLPQPTYEPVPLDESERIQELTKQLGLMSPQAQMQSFDPLGLKKRSGGSVEVEPGYATTKRTFGDNAKSALNLLFEGIRAAGGGRQYQNPWDRQRQIYEEDYKREAPRLIDELKILNQNKRAFEADQSRMKIQEMKNEASVEASRITANARKYAADRAGMSADERTKLQKEQQAWFKKYGKNASPETIAMMQSLQFDLTQNDPEKAQQYLDTRDARNNRNILFKDASAGLLRNGQPVIQPFTTTTTAFNNDLGEYTDRTTQGSRIVKVPGPFNAQIIQQTLQGSPLTGQALSNNPSLLGIPGLTTPQGNPLQTVPSTGQQGQPAATPVPGLAPAGTQRRRTPTAKPAATASPLGAPAVNRTDVIDLPITKISDDFSNSYPQIQRAKSEGLIPETNLVQNKIFSIQDSKMTTPTAGVIDLRRAFAGNRNKKLKEDFLGTVQSASTWASLVDLAARQYIKHDGNLMMGFGTDVGKLLQRRAPSKTGAFGAVGELMSGAGVALSGREMESADDTIGIMSSRAFLDDLFRNSGKQTNLFESKLFEDLNPTDKLAPDIFMQRVIREAIKANIRVQELAEQAAGKVTTFNRPTAAMIDEQVNDIMKLIRTPARDRKGNMVKGIWDIELLNPAKLGRK
jgi:hypothetical protein